MFIQKAVKIWLWIINASWAITVLLFIGGSKNYIQGSVDFVVAVLSISALTYYLLNSDYVSTQKRKTRRV